jgi:hypothetical protein
MITSALRLGQELLQRPQRGVDQLLVLQQLLDVALHLAEKPSGNAEKNRDINDL